jgi:hypothetical protein
VFTHAVKKAPVKDDTDGLLDELLNELDDPKAASHKKVASFRCDSVQVIDPGL